MRFFPDVSTAIINCAMKYMNKNHTGYLVSALYVPGSLQTQMDIVSSPTHTEPTRLALPSQLLCFQEFGKPVTKQQLLKIELCKFIIK